MTRHLLRFKLHTLHSVLQHTLYNRPLPQHPNQPGADRSHVHTRPLLSIRQIEATVPWRRVNWWHEIAVPVHNCWLRSKRDKKYSDLEKWNFGAYEGAQIRAFCQSGRILSLRPAARKAQDKRLLASYPPAGRTFNSIRVGGERGGRRLLIGRKEPK